ncbi:GNAT family N-acetyltransferase [Rhizobacter sp. OV335]|uniref:GNAT family N-acetyltransferase n=1 Tax=Rhizobacter sp. OV335 TaxID=1500264 RepID=UPI00093781EC
MSSIATSPERSSPLASNPGGAPESSRFSWVPIRSMSERHRERISMHLLSLNESDRYLRFGYPATDAQIERYVASLNFERDELFGIFNRRLQLIALAHLAYAPVSRPEDAAMAEFGVSVASHARGRGYGARLFERAVLQARNRGCDRLFIHALSENTAMLKIARRAGALVERDGSESEAWLKLPPDSLASQMGQLVERHAAELNYQFKRHTQRIGSLLDTVTEVKAHVSGTRRVASE